VDFVAKLTHAGIEVIFADSKHDLVELGEKLATADAWIAGTSPVTDEMLALAPKLKILARYGVGFESVDLSAAKAREIVVTNTPGANSLAVAELTIGLTIAALRGIAQSAQKVVQNDWSVIRGQQLEGSIVGIIGFGRIGRILASKLQALGCEIWICDPFINANEIVKLGFKSKTPIEIAVAAQIVSLNAPGDVQIVDAGWMAVAQADQVIINTARAELVDESAIADGLRSGALFAYAADTLKGEKNSKESPLMATDIADKVTITAHLGAQTVGAVDLMGEMSTANVIAVLAGGSPLNPVAL
ncbi:MAG: NAD(P)-dependent oxidoreductase, partial [Actinomycetes bacterium]